MRPKLTFLKLATFLACIYFSPAAIAQCAAGQAKVTIKVYGDQYVDTENGITLSLNGSPVTLTPTSFAATTSTKWHVFTAPCTTVGGKIVVNMTDAFGDGIGASVGGNNVYIYVNNELVDSLGFTSGLSASTSSHNTNFTTNVGPNSTCATASSNTVAVFSAGATVSSSTIPLQNPAANHTNFNQLSTTTRTECGTFVATAASMDFYAYGGESNLPSGTSAPFGPVSMQVFNSACTQVGSTLSAQGGTVAGLTVGQTYTFCGTRSVLEQTNFPISTAELTSIYLGTKPSIIVPLQLLEFSGIGSGTQNLLTWRTANEQDLSYYEIQRSVDGVNFQTIANINAKNNYANDYSFSDVNFNTTDNFYRLKINSINNSLAKYSSIINLRNIIKTMSIGNINPNPAVGEINIPFSSPVQQTLNYQILDLSGKIVTSGNFYVSAGSSIKYLNIANLAKGIFVLRIYANNKMINTQKIIKQ